MPKNSKPKNDLRSIRKETAAFLFIGALLCLVAYSLIVSLTDLSPVYGGVAALILYGGACTLAYHFLEKRTYSGKLDETLAPVMGRIMFDAVTKMNAPVFICDKNERIVWYNTAMESLSAGKDKLYGASLVNLFGVNLADIRGDRSEKGALITSGERSFYAKYSHIKTDDNDFALIVTSEITELAALHEKMAGDELVVSYIMIDNLAEMMQYDSELYRPAAAQLDLVLREWANEYGGILKEYERDKYIFITESRVLDEIVLGKFDILERVRAIKVGEANLPLTVSMGVSNIHGSFEEREKAAHAALDMALQRGGDQAAVKGDASMDFYGGVTKSVQKRSNVRARVVSGELMRAMKSASNVLIMGHKAADFDAFGACVGLARMAMYCGARVNVVTNMADANLRGCRSLMEPEEDFLGVFVSGAAALDLLETGSLVVVADVNNLENTEEPELAYRTEKLAVIDHHRKNAEFVREPDVEYIEPSISATCEIVAEMLEQVLPKDDLTAAEANVMLAGITLDTNQFTKNTGTRTFSAAMYLRDRGADPAVVQSLFHESFEDYMREAKFRRNVEFYRGACAITIVDDPDSADRAIAAKAANNLLKVDGIRASFAIIRLGEALHISARSDGKLNVQLIMSELGGGGHFDSAAVQRSESIEQVVEMLKAAIDKYL